MKSIYILIFILLATFIISSCKKKEVTLSSQPENDLEIRNGITYNTKTNMPFVGKYVNYYPKSKTKEMELNYKDGLLDGEIFCYSENGQPDYDVHFSMGKLSGRYKHWIQSGELMFDFDIDTNASIIPTYAYPQGEKLLYYYFNHSIPLDTILSLLGTEYTKYERKLGKYSKTHNISINNTIGHVWNYFTFPFQFQDGLFISLLVHDSGIVIDYDADDTLYYEPHQRFNDSVLDKNGFKLIKYTEKPIIQSRTKKLSKNTTIIMNEYEKFGENSKKSLRYEFEIKKL